MGCRWAMDCMVPPASDCSSRWRVEPVHLKAFPERHARSMQHHPEVAVGDGQDGANLLTGHTVHFAHRENSTDFFWQFRKAITHYLPELSPMHHRIWLRLPLMRTEVVVPKTDRHEFL